MRARCHGQNLHSIVRHKIWIMKPIRSTPPRTRCSNCIPFSRVAATARVHVQHLSHTPFIDCEYDFNATEFISTTPLRAGACARTSVFGNATIALCPETPRNAHTHAHNLPYYERGNVRCVRAILMAANERARRLKVGALHAK